MKNEVKVLKLTTGEEVIARVTESDIQITEGDGVDMLILEAPMKITAAPKPDGTMEMGMIKWIEASRSAPIDIEIKHIVVIVDPTDKMEKTYLSWLTGVTL